MVVKEGDTLKCHVGEVEVIKVKVIQKVWTKRKSDGFKSYFELREGVQYCTSLVGDMSESDFYEKVEKDA